jgi:hypothetical protein
VVQEGRSDVAEGIVEVRDYTIEAEWLEPYRTWATDLAGPFLAANLDVIDFWMDEGEEAEVSGSNPVVSPNGQPNVCWIIRWPSREAREAGWEQFRADPEWQAIWAKHPNTAAYLQINVRFLRSVL